MSLKIGVLVKQVPDTNTKIELKDGKIDETNMKFVMNPYDEFAVEEAVKTKEKWSAAGEQVEIVGICLGKKASAKVLRDAFAVGVDRGVLIVDEAGAASESSLVAEAIAKVAKEENFHLIFAGKQAIDTDSHSVAQMVSEHLGLPHIGVVSKVDWNGTASATVERDVEGGVKETYELTLPAMITTNKGLNKMRLASLPNIRKAGQKELKEVSFEPTLTPSFKILSWSLPAERAGVKMISGSAQEQADELVRVLREEAKVI